MNNKAQNFLLAFVILVEKKRFLWTCFMHRNWMKNKDQCKWKWCTWLVCIIYSSILYQTQFKRLSPRLTVRFFEGSRKKIVYACRDENLISDLMTMAFRRISESTCVPWPLDLWKFERRSWMSERHRDRQGETKRQGGKKEGQAWNMK